MSSYDLNLLTIRVRYSNFFLCSMPFCLCFMNTNQTSFGYWIFNRLRFSYIYIYKTLFQIDRGVLVQGVTQFVTTLFTWVTQNFNYWKQTVLISPVGKFHPPLYIAVTKQVIKNMYSSKKVKWRKNYRLLGLKRYALGCFKYFLGRGLLNDLQCGY